MIEKRVNGDHPSPATLWRVAVESWLRCQGLILVRQNQNRNVSTTLSNIWSHNSVGPTVTEYQFLIYGLESLYFGAFM